MMLIMTSPERYYSNSIDDTNQPTAVPFTAQGIIEIGEAPHYYFKASEATLNLDATPTVIFRRIEALARFTIFIRVRKIEVAGEGDQR
jgi:hypothetical protein